VSTIEPQLNLKDESILTVVRESPDGIRQIELSRRTGLHVNDLRWRIMGLAAKGKLKIVNDNNKVTIYPAEA
jgi:predicted transcriptional regulator